MASDKGKAAISRYRATPAGRESAKTYNARFRATPAGRESASGKDARFRATPAGRESAKTYNAKYRATPAGRESAKAYNAKYSSSLPGRLASDAKAQNYRKTPHGHKMRASYERKRFRDTDSTLLGEHREQLEDFPEEEYSQGRKAAYDIIKNHVIESNKLAKFNKLKAKLEDSHTSVYLPNLPLIAGEKSSSKKEWKKKVMFARSKSILQWKNTSARIFEKSLSDEKAEELLKAWFPTMNFETNTTSYKRTFAATQLGIKVLNTRDLWIRKLYGSIHQLNIFSENMINQDKIDNPAEEKADQIMGWKLHQNGHEAYKELLKFSYVDGKPFNFKYDKQSKKSKEKRVEAEWCRTSCIPATHDEIDLFKQVLRTCLQLDVRNGRQFIRDSNICPSYDDDTHMYKLIVDKRNHPETCYQSDAANWNGEGPPCLSNLRRLRRLSYHYKNARLIFSNMNELKIADKFISDFDTATAVGDVAYLLKLLDFKPHYSPKTFELERSHTVVNEATVMEKYGHHYTNYLNAISSLPSVPCISCNVLSIADQKHCRLITDRWSKLHKVGSEYTKLLKYLQSEEWQRKGGVRVDTLVGKRICNYCFRKMDKGELPRTSLRNNMDIGTVPKVIADLNQFEVLFIKLASHFATYVKLGTTLGSRRNNEKMQAIKGFTVSIPVPVQNNISELGDGRPGKLIDPQNYIMLHQQPTKNKVVWKNLVDVNMIFAALEWLIVNNPLYSNIRLPDSPEDILRQFDDDLENMCDDQTQSVPLPPSSCKSCIPSLISPESSLQDIGLTPEGVVPLFPFDSQLDADCAASSTLASSRESCIPSHISPESCSTASSEANRDSGDTYMDCSSACSPLPPVHSDTSNSSENEPASKRPRPRKTVLFLTESEVSDEEQGDDDIHGGCDELEGISLFTAEESELKPMLDTAVTITDAEMQRLDDICDLKTKKKLVMVNCMNQMSRMVASSRTLCLTCDKLISEFRAKLTDVVGYEASLFGQGYLNNIFQKLREALLYEDYSIVHNICAYCQAEMLNPGYVNVIMFPKARRTTKRGLSKTFSKRKTAMNNYAQYSAKTMCNVLQKIDHLKEVSALCYKCHTKTEASMKRVIPHYYRATLFNKLKLKNNALDIMDVHGTTLTLEERSGREEYQNKLIRCCVRCDKGITPIYDMLHTSISEKSCDDTPSESVVNDSQTTYVHTRNVNGDKNQYTNFETMQFTNSDAAKAKADNKDHLRCILRDIKLALRGTFLCPSASCIKGIKDLIWIFRELQIGWFRGHRVSLKQFDPVVMEYLKDYYSVKLADTLKKRLCFHCGAGSQLLGGESGASKTDISNNDGATDDLNNNSDNNSDTDTKGSSEDVGDEDYRTSSDDNRYDEDNDGDDDDSHYIADDNADDKSNSNKNTQDNAHNNADDDPDNYDGAGIDGLDGFDDDEGVTDSAEDTDYDDNTSEWDWMLTNEEVDEAKPEKDHSKTQVSENGVEGDESARADAPEKEGEQTEDLPEDEAAAESQKKMLERMTREDLKNMLESFTVTRMDQVDTKEVPDLQDEMYRLLRMDDEALDMEDGRLDLMCFPEIFSYGVGEKRASTDDREEKANPLQYEKTRLLSANSSSRRHSNYLFHLSEECERRKIRQSIFSTMKNVPGLGRLSAGAILAKISQSDDKLLKNIDKVLRKVPNTKAYWKSVRVKLRAQIEKFGPPSFFITFSPAEYDWPDLIKWLREQNADIPNIDQLSPAAVLNIDPVLTSIYMHQRFNALWDFILKAEPLGKVVSWFIRNEYQSRGTCHWHTFLWVEDCPILNKDKDEDVANFIQKHATCRIPSATEEPTLLNIVTRYQSHTCRPSYCIRSLGKRPKGSKGPRAACKFGFPRVKCKRFTLHSVLSCVIARKKNAMRKRLYDLARSEEERRINDYNDVLSFLWGANMDIQYLAESSHSISEYITKYITKPEEASLKDFKDDLSDKSKSVYQKYCSHAYKWMKQREMGAHEAADRILQNSGEMWRSSEKFEWLQATMPKRRSRTLRPLKDIKNQDPNSKNIFFDNWVDTFYPNRPKTAEFEEMSIFDFVSKLDKASLPANGPNTNTTKYQKIHDISTGKFIRTLQRRSKEPVLYHTYYNRHSHPEEFYYSMLFLHKHWRVEADIIGDSATYQEEFFKAVELFPRLKEMASRRLDIEKARDKLEADAKQAPEAAEGHGQHSEEDDDEPQGISDYRNINANSDIQTQEQLDEVVGSLNKQQIAIYYEVTQKLEQMVAHEKNGCNDDCAPDCKKPLLLYVSGFGGTGKSYLIRAIKGYMFVRKKDFSDPIDIALH